MVKLCVRNVIPELVCVVSMMWTVPGVEPGFSRCVWKCVLPVIMVNEHFRCGKVIMTLTTSGIKWHSTSTVCIWSSDLWNAIAEQSFLNGGSMWGAVWMMKVGNKHCLNDEIRNYTLYIAYLCSRNSPPFLCPWHSCGLVLLIAHNIPDIPMPWFVVLFWSVCEILRMPHWSILIAF